MLNDGEHGSNSRKGGSKLRTTRLHPAAATVAIIDLERLKLISDQLDDGVVAVIFGPRR